MNKNPGMESVDAEGSTEPLASIKNSKRDHTIYFDNEDGVYSFLPRNIHRTKPSLWWHGKLCESSRERTMFQQVGR